MNIIKTKYLNDLEVLQINDLWNEEYPINLKDRFGILLVDVTHFNHYLIKNEADKIIAWAVEFEKDNEIRFSIIVNKNQQGKGLGKALINRLKEDLTVFYGWVIDHDQYLKPNGEKYFSPLSFYLKQGFEILKEQRIDTAILNAVKIKRNL